MNNRKIATRASLSMAVALVASAFAPTAALAEGISGTDILIPKMGEFLPELIAFLVVWGVLAKFGWPMIMETMEKREAKIKGDIEAAEQDRIKASQQLQAYEAKMADANRDAEAIIAEAKRTAQASASRIESDAREQAGEILARGRANVESERKAAMMDLQGSIADISVNAAGKILDENLDTEAQRKLVKKYLSQVGGFDAR